MTYNLFVKLLGEPNSYDLVLYDVPMAEIENYIHNHPSLLFREDEILITRQPVDYEVLFDGTMGSNGRNLNISIIDKSIAKLLIAIEESSDE